MGDPISSLSNLALKVGKLAYEEAMYLGSVAEKLRRLRAELIWMKCFLKDAAARRSREEIVGVWVAEVREYAYDAEDIIDTFEVKIGSSKRQYGRFCLPKENWWLHKMGKQMDELADRISDLNRRALTYGIRPLQGGEASSSAWRVTDRETFPHNIEKDIVGFDSYIRKLVSVLQDKEESQKYEVVTISGMGGLGKTTLAKKVYNHNEIRRHFGCFAWAYISQQYQTRDVWQNILLQLESAGPMRRSEILNLTPTELAQQLQNVLLQKKCLVVLDDLWRDQDWNSLEAAFPSNQQISTSKILITTRDQGVAQGVQNRFLQEPACLDEDKSWQLLLKTLFSTSTKDDLGSNIGIEITKKELAREMVKHCGGLPLAIRVLGGLLSTKVTLAEWKMVHEHIKSQIARGGSQGQENKGVRNILASSYKDLPAHLKSCFTYLAQFPEDYEINVEKLMQMWIAEGMIEPVTTHWEEDQEELEDVAEIYLSELIRRSMVLVGKRNEDGILQTCHLHDLMRDLCLSKAKEENMLQILNRKVRDDKSEIHSMSSLFGNVRRLAIHDELKQLYPNPQLRSLWLFCDIFSEKELSTVDGCLSDLALKWKLYSKSRQFWIFMTKEYKLLRVLNLEGVVLCGSPHGIGELVHLKMLIFGYLRVKLPSSLAKLRCLQTLYFLLDTRFDRIPNVLWKLEQLRHLHLPSLDQDEITIRIGIWRNLRVLINCPWNEGDVEALGEASQLRVLHVVKFKFTQSLVEALSHALVNLRLLQSLSIQNLSSYSDEHMDIMPVLLALQRCPYFYKLNLNLRLVSVPTDYQMFPLTITHLTMHFSELFNDPMPTLEQLPNLQSLILSDRSFFTKEMVCSATGFPKLDYLSLYGLDKLERMVIPKGAMSKLRRMSIRWCPMLLTIPDTLRFIKSLEELKIEKMSWRFTERLAPGGADYEIIQHIPFVHIGQ